MLTVPEAARRTGRHPETVRRWIREGKLPATKVGTQHVIDETDLARFATGDRRRPGSHRAVPRALTRAPADARVDEVVIAEREERTLRGDLYRPAGEGPWPGLVMLHGGAFTKGSRASYGRWGRFLAANGYAALAAEYRLATRARTTYPEAIVDAKAAVRRLRGSAQELGVDPQRLGVLGGSAGGYLAAMVGLTGDDAAFGEPDASLAAVSDRVSVVIPMAGYFDLIAAWAWDRAHRPPDDQALEWFLGGNPTSARSRWLAASPLVLASAEVARDTRWLIAYGTEDDVVPADLHARPMVDALKLAGATVRTVPLVGAPHFWYMEGDVDATNPYAELMGTRLLTFLETWSGW